MVNSHNHARQRAVINCSAWVGSRGAGGRGQGTGRDGSRKELNWVLAPSSLKRSLKLCAVRSHFSRVRLFATLWTIACQPPLFIEFSRQEYWSGLSWSSPGHLPDPGTEPTSPVLPASPALAGRFFITSATWEALKLFQ